MARWLADILDARIRVPGTDIRVGIDPLIGLVPGLGDALASVLGSLLLVLAVHCRVPRIVLVRMASHILLNGALGAVPVLGDLFSVWFKSNLRNAELLERHVAVERASTVGDWLFVIGLVVVMLALLAGVVVGLIWVIAALWRFVG